MKRGPPTGILSLLCCLPPRHFLTSLSLYSLSVQFKRANNFGSVLPYLWIVEFTRPNSRHTSAYFFPLSICRVTRSFCATFKTFLLFQTVAMLSRYQSPLICSSRKVEGNFKHKVNYRYCCLIPGLEQRAWTVKSEESVEFVTYFIYWKIILERMTGNVVISEVDAPMCIVLNKVEKHALYRELVGTREHITLQPRCRTYRGLCNRVKLYLYPN